MHIGRTSGWDFWANTFGLVLTAAAGGASSGGTEPASGHNFSAVREQLLKLGTS